MGHIVTTAARFSQPAQKLVANDILKRYGIEIRLHALPQIHDMLQIVGKDVFDIWRQL